MPAGVTNARFQPRTAARSHRHSPFLAGVCQISTTSNVMPDIHTYIDTSVTDKLMSRKLTDDLALLDEVKRVLLEESSGM